MSTMNAGPLVIKIGGHELDDPDFLSALGDALAQLHEPVIIVHGGGKEISALQTRLGIEPRYVDGVRITDAATLELVTMVLCGLVNKRVVRGLLDHGIEALGMSGVDRHLIRALPMVHETIDMGFTGRPEAVRGDLLRAWVADGITPVIAPICSGPTSALNVNADHVAGAVAAAVGARRVVFLTNVEGVLVDAQVVPALTEDRVRQLIAEGVIFGGMIPKVQTALAALADGAAQAAITNLRGLATHGGTTFERVV